MKDKNKIIFVVVIFILSIILFFLHKHTVKEGLENSCPINTTQIQYADGQLVCIPDSESGEEIDNNIGWDNNDNIYNVPNYMDNGYANEFPDRYNMYQKFMYNPVFNPGGGSLGPGMDEGGFDDEWGEGWDGPPYNEGVNMWGPPYGEGEGIYGDGFGEGWGEEGFYGGGEGPFGELGGLFGGGIGEGGYGMGGYGIGGYGIGGYGMGPYSMGGYGMGPYGMGGYGMGGYGMGGYVWVHMVWEVMVWVHMVWMDMVWVHMVWVWMVMVWEVMVWVHMVRLLS